MENLNAQELIDVAKQLKIIARAINDFQLDNWDDLTSEQFNNLNKAERDILLTVHDLISQSVIVLAGNSEELINEIKGATVKVEKSLKEIHLVSKVIKIATASVFFASALVSQNPAAISLSLEGLGSSLED